jgi:glutathione S-transferase
MITLHTFGSMFGLPDPSPFVTKGDVLLKMSGVPYQSVIGDLREAPKGKMPFIMDKGAKIGDSTLIRLHLEQNYGIDFDKHLSPAEKGIAWSVEKMLEDNLYWALVSERWMDDANFEKGPKHFFDSAPALIRPLIVAMVRRGVRKTLHGQGLGRHTRDELLALACRDIDALAAVLGDKPYLMGANKCGADATVFAFSIGVLCPLFASSLCTHAEQYKNLVAYGERMRKEFYP